MTDLFVLVPAPVLGPESWRPAGAELTRTGHQVVVLSLAEFTAGGPPYAPRLVGLWAEQVTEAADLASRAEPRADDSQAGGPPAGGPQAGGSPANGPSVSGSQPGVPGGPPERVVLVAHSGAGPFADQLAAAVRLAVPAGRVAVIFADADPPAPSGPAPVVSARFLPYLNEIASGGVVPPWEQWWPEAELAELFPTEAARAAVLADTRPLPLAFFEETLPAADGPGPGELGYLLFSAGYEPEARRARARGWPVTELDGSHVHQLVAPTEVAAAIVGLAERLA